MGIKVLSLFDGMSCGMIAFKESNIDVDRYVAYEIDEYAIETSKHNFPEIEQYGDVFKADFTQYEGFDFVVGGSPCFTKGHYVLTDNGYVDISEIKVGDMVLTHTGSYKPVIRTNTRYAETYRLKVDGFMDFITTKNHPFYTITSEDDFVSDPQWTPVGELTTKHFCGRHQLVEKLDIDIPHTIVAPEAKLSVFKNNIIWTQVKSVNSTGNIETVYNIEVADDNSYTVNNCIVHNCTYWSIAKTSGRETTASGMGWDLFSQYVRAIKECKPKYFIYENNYSMSNEIRAMIDKSFGFGAVMINSALVSAQNRQRLYWVGVRQADGSYKRAYVPQPTDLHIYMNDILDTNDSYCMRYERSDEAKQCRKDYEAHIVHHGFRELHELHPRPDGKSNTVSTILKDNPILTPINLCEDNKSHAIKAGYYKQGIANFITNPAFDATGVAELVDECERVGNMPTSNGDEVTSRQNRIYSTKGKSCTVTTSFNPNYAITLDEDMEVEEATNRGYTDIHPGDCVDMAMEGSKTRRGRNMKYKSNCLTTSNDFYQYMGTLSKTIYEVKDGMITVNGRTYPIKLRDGKYIIRKLSVDEASRLQTIPDWYVFPVSDSQAYKMIGNGWTIKVIQHLITCAMNNPTDAISGSTYVGTPKKLF